MVPLNSHDLAAQVETVVHSGYLSSLVGNLEDIPKFWQQTLKDYPNHPVGADPELQRSSLPLTLYCHLAWNLEALLHVSFVLNYLNVLHNFPRIQSRRPDEVMKRKLSTACGCSLSGQVIWGRISPTQQPVGCLLQCFLLTCTRLTLKAG